MFLIFLSNLKTKVDNLDVDKLETVSVDLIKLSDIVSKEVVKKKNTTQVNSLEKKILDGSSLIQRYKYNTDKQNLEGKMEILIKNIWH